MDKHTVLITGCSSGIGAALALEMHRRGWQVFATARRPAALQPLADKGLPLPAYDQCILTSHVFNLLDARGAISVAERAQYIRRIRELACRCAEAWVEVTAPAEAEAGGAA